MQDRFVGDIGDYCKLGLLRALTESELTLAINWYKTEPESIKVSELKHGKFIDYLSIEQYKKYDSQLFKKLKKLIDKNSRNINSINKSIVNAISYSDPVPKNHDRQAWHTTALATLGGTDVVFLDPDIGIETRSKISKNSHPRQYVRWSEITDYYKPKQNQSLIIYQDFQRMEENDFLKTIFQLQSEFINADAIRIIKYSSRRIRYFILLLHKKHCKKVDDALASIEKRGQKVTKALSSIKNRKNLQKFCEVIYKTKRY